MEDYNRKVGEHLLALIAMYRDRNQVNADAGSDEMKCGYGSESARSFTLILLK